MLFSLTLDTSNLPSFWVVNIKRQKWGEVWMGKSFIVNVCSISIGFILKIKRGTEFSTHILKKLLNTFCEWYNECQKILTIYVNLLYWGKKFEMLPQTYNNLIYEKNKLGLWEKPNKRRPFVISFTQRKNVFLNVL